MKITITNSKNLKTKVNPLRWDYDYNKEVSYFTGVSKVHYGNYEILVTRDDGTQLKDYKGEVTNHPNIMVATVAANKLHKTYMEKLIKEKNEG